MTVPDNQPQNNPEMFIRRLFITWISLVIAFLITNELRSQTCDDVMDVTSFPFTHDWCLTEGEIEFVENPHSMLDPVFGCWHCMGSPRWFRFTFIEESHLSMEVHSDLTNTWTGFNPVSTYFAVMTDCPFDGGTVLSYPINGNNPSGDCWDDFGGEQWNDDTDESDFITWSCWEDGCCSWSPGVYCYPSGVEQPPFDLDEVDGGQPPWNFPSHSYMIEWNVDPGEYWIAVFPPTSCTSFTTAVGCISVTFDGLGFLSLENIGPEIELVSTPEGLKVDIDGVRFDLLGRRIK